MSRQAISRATAAGALVLAITGCSAPSTPAGSPTAGTTPATVESASAESCVADPQAVISRALPPAAAGPMPEPVATALDAAAKEGLAQAPTAGTVVAVRSPEGTWVKAYGLADQATNTPMSTDVYQRIGSVTKTFTGTLVLQLVQDGSVELDDPISKHLDGIPRGDDVTVRMLLNMTSGIASYTMDEGFQRDLFTEPNKVWTPDQLLALGLSLPRSFEPGAQFEYSNTNTVVLGKLIEKRRGLSYDEALRTGIFEPLELAGTSMPGPDGALPPPHPTGLTLQGLPDGVTTPQDATDWNPTWAWSAGQLTSTAEDLLTYGRAMATGQGLVDAPTQTERLTFEAPAGYGLAVGCIDGWLGHTGELPGFNTTLFYDTRSDTIVTVLANSDIASGDCTETPTLPDTPKDLPCMDPAVRIFVAVSAALGHEFRPQPKT